MPQIDGPQEGKLSRAIQDAFPQWPRLDSALREKLDDSYAKYTGGLGDQYRDVVPRVISEYNRQYQIPKLVVGLLEDSPANASLIEFAWDHGILRRPAGNDGTVSPNDGSLERVIDPQRGFSDPMAFLRRYWQVVKCICRVSVPFDAGVEYGTGFLIGDETLITNYHVVQSVIEKKAGADRKTVRLLFDYHTGPDGQTVSSGVEYKLVDDPDGWLIDASKYDLKDLTIRSVAENIAVNRADDCLDYAILRVSDSPGTKRLGSRPSSNGDTRGHLPLPKDSESRFDQDFEKDKAAVFVFQHPSKEPLRLDWEKPAILGVNANRTRVLYNVNTQHGSSGSPCLNAKLELIALHHAGGRDWPADVEYLYNQGIPIGRIRALLEKRNKLSEIK